MTADSRAIERLRLMGCRACRHADDPLPPV
jgi:hypothetical protein